jgi:hypothetical protein
MLNAAENCTFLENTPSNFENAVNDRKCGIFTVKLDLESGRRCVATESKSEVWYSVVPCSELFFCCLLARGESFPLPRGRENPESGVETKRLLTPLLLLLPPRLATSCAKRLGNAHLLSTIDVAK